MSSVPPSCCHLPDQNSHNHGRKPPVDWVLWIATVIVAGTYALSFFGGGDHDHGSAFWRFTDAVHEITREMIWGVVIGIAALGFLSRVPREMVMGALGSSTGLRGILRATVAGVLFDVCSHGILMIGAKLYERGATLGQTMAFLIASPWNSISLTFVLISLIGLPWTLTFIVLSMMIGIFSGLALDLLVQKGVLPDNPAPRHSDPSFRFWPEAMVRLKNVSWSPEFILETLKIGTRESGMILRWLFIGVIITGLLQVFFASDALYQDIFGPSLKGLGITFAVATVMEVCSEGALPIAADIFRRTGAIGNSFAFLMAGVATNYTTLLVLRQATRSWKIALFLPLVSVPQILLIGFLLNNFR